MIYTVTGANGDTLLRDTTLRVVGVRGGCYALVRERCGHIQPVFMATGDGPVYSARWGLTLPRCRRAA